MTLMQTATMETAWKDFEERRDADSFAVLYEQARPLVATMAWRAVRDNETAEEVVAALFARLWTNPERRPRPGLSARQAFIGWTFDEARTANRRRWRQRDRERPMEAAEMIPESSRSLREEVEKQLMAERVRALIATLPEKYREALLACHIEGLTVEEASRALGRPAETVKTQARRGRELLEKKLRAAGITLTVAAAMAALSNASAAGAKPLTAAEIIERADSLVSSAGPIASGSALVGKGMLFFGAAVLVLLLFGGAHFSGIAPWLGGAEAMQEDKVAGVNSFESVEEDGSSDVNGEANNEDQPTQSINESDDAGVEVAVAPVAEGLNEEPIVEEETGNLHIFGKVTDKVSGMGIPEATIDFYAGNSDEDFTGMLINLPTPTASAKTGPDGTYSVRFNSRAFELQQGLGAYVSATADHARQFGLAFPLPSENPNERRLDFVLSRAESISGNVVDENDAPVAGALVGNLILGQPDLTNAMSGAISLNTGLTTTESDGYFRLDGLPAGVSFEVPVRADGFAPTMSEPLETGTRGAKIVLRRGTGRIFGKVMKSGKPVANIDVSLREANAGNSMDFVRQTVMSKNSRTAADGSFSFEHMAAGSYTVSARQGQSGTESVGYTSADVELAENDSREVNLQFADDARIEGIAVDAATGDPLAGVRISRSPYYSVNLDDDMIEINVPDRKEIVTGVDGRFEISLPVGGSDNSVTFHYKQPAGYMASADVWAISNSIRLSKLQPGATQKVELKLPRGATLRGRVVTAEGTPAANVLVRQRSNNDVSVRSDAEGRFEMAVYYSDNVQLSAHQDPFIAYTEIRVPKDGDVPFVELVLARGSRISGRVYDEMDKPMTARVQAKLPRIGGGYRMGPMAITNSTGFYDLGYFPAGKVTVAVFGMTQTQAIELDNRHLELEQGVDYTEDFHIGDGEMLDGVVTDEEFQPIPNASLRAWLGSEGSIFGTELTTVTDKDGYYRFTGLPKGSIKTLSIGHQKYQQKSFSDLEITGEPLNIVLLPKRSVTVRVVDSTGNPVRRFQYRVMDMASKALVSAVAVALESADGSFTLDGLEDHAYRVDVAETNAGGAATGRRAAHKFDLGLEPSDTVVVTVGETYAVRGRVLEYGTDSPIGGARVSLQRPWIYGQGKVYNEMLDTVEAITDADGRFELHGVPAGTHSLDADMEVYNLFQVVPVTAGPEGGSEAIIKMVRK